MTVHIQFEDDELPSLQLVLNRAMNTWDPLEVPKWCWELDKLVAKKLSGIKEKKNASDQVHF